ncbi:PhlD [Streptomyces sp. NPDC059788]|uniref:PhlD n=1 Tax=Streptomyces sp. NPDC059788 TaxID=3346948 RepID=UPI003656D317
MVHVIRRPVYVNRPGIAEADYIVENSPIVEDIATWFNRKEDDSAEVREAKYATAKEVASRIAGQTGVTYRRFNRPLHEVAEPIPMRERNDRAVSAVRQLSFTAAERALTAAGIDAADITGLITFNATGDRAPGPDAAVINALGLRPDIFRVPMTQLACAGGAHALGLAARLVGPDDKFLVVGAEDLSTSYQRSDNTAIEHIAYKLLFGDGGAGTVVSGEPLADPGLVIEETWQYLQPDTLDAYATRHEADGLHFDSTKEALKAVSAVLPHLPWPGQEAEFAVLHPGSRKILNLIEEKGGVSPEAARLSHEVLANGGNGGGPTALRILDRLHDDPPAPGACGLKIGFGPGFCAVASRVRWIA